MLRDVEVSAETVEFVRGGFELCSRVCCGSGVRRMRLIRG